MLLKNLEEKFSELQAAWQAGDVSIVRECAHQLKTDASYLGASQLGELLLEMERQAIQGKLPTRDEFSRVESLLHQVRTSYNP